MSTCGHMSPNWPLKFNASEVEKQAPAVLPSWREHHTQEDPSVDFDSPQVVSALSAFHPAWKQLKSGMAVSSPIWV